MKATMTNIIGTCVLGVMATTASASQTPDPTLPEERKGAVIGGVVGASVGGPIGAAAGAMVGGGLLGKLVGANRINGELEAEVGAAQQQLDEQAREFETRLAAMSDELRAAKAKRATSPRLPIQFRTASSDLEKHYENELAGVARQIARQEGVTVRLAGFADRRGDEDYNLELSKQRVEAVKQFLVRHGVARSRIETAAYGETKPVAEEPTPENHFFDRRVVLQVSVDDLPLASR